MAARRQYQSCLRAGHGWKPKLAFRTERDALNHLRDIKEEGGEVYHCEHCNNYHTSFHKKKGTR